MTFLYFAYGANMNHELMSERCASSRFLCSAFLEDHKFVFDGFTDTLVKRSIANIVYSEGSIVWGGLFEVDDTDLEGLDASESHPASFEKKNVTIKNPSGQSFEAIVYHRMNKIAGSPSREYRQILVQGAKDCGLPERYTLNLTYRITV